MPKSLFKSIKSSNNKEIRNILSQWGDEVSETEETELKKQVREAEKIINNPIQLI
ncbi:hypothetical protein C1645_839883 [Glomus cerebriforme]|uniref:Uncharacterized protein n=1 Tax=Glomus cerebriforme TaxID=658196 RepID=A0A397S4Z4_9GLOM|nr:hypothetical protein C1645_839883 [Glomus cerebriforme]